MTSDAAAVLREALALPETDRADVAAELLSSLGEPDAEDPGAVRAMWTAELERRAQGVLSGEAPGEDWAELRQRLAGELSG